MIYMTVMSYLKPEGHDFEDELEGEDCSENQVEDVQRLGVGLGLALELHRKTHGVEHNEDKNGVLKGLWRHKPPNFVLEPVLRDISPNRFRPQRKLYAVSL